MPEEELPAIPDSRGADVEGHRVRVSAEQRVKIALLVWETILVIVTTADVIVSR